MIMRSLQEVFVNINFELFFRVKQFKRTAVNTTLLFSSLLALSKNKLACLCKSSLMFEGSAAEWST